MIRTPARALAKLLVAVSMISCMDAATGVSSRPAARIGVATSFSTSAVLVYAQRRDFTGVTFDRVRLVLRRAGAQAVAKDTTVTFSPVSPDLTLNFPIPGALPGDLYSVNVQFLLGAAVIYTGTSSAQAYLPGGAVPPPAQVVVAYVGPGATAARVTVSPRTLTVEAPATAPFTAAAVDSSNAPVPQVPLRWSVSDTTIATISASGVMTTTGKRGTTAVIATTVTGLADTATVTVTLPPAAITLVSGGGQSGPVLAALAAPFVVKVTDVAGNTLAGVPVAWAGTNGTLASPTTTTDVTGTTSNVLTLGSALGAASATATVGSGGNARSVTIAATALPGAPTALAVGTAPTTGTAAAVLTPALTVELRDASGNLAAGTNNVVIAFGANPGGATLGGTLTRAAVSGVATFNDLTVSAPGVGYTLVASSVGLSSVTTPAFTVTAVNGTRTWTGVVSTDWSNPANWTGGVPSSADDAVVPTGTANAPALTANAVVKSVTVASGASLSLGAFTLDARGNVNGGTGPGITGSGTITMGNTSTLAGVVPNISLVTGSVSLAGPTTINGNLSIPGGGFGATFTVNGALTVTGTVSTNGPSAVDLSTFVVTTGGTATVGALNIAGASGIFSQTGGTLTVNGTANFNGNNATGKITGGTLILNGDFVETGSVSTADFVASGTHRTIFNRAAGSQDITMTNPFSSRFQDLSLAGTATINYSGTTLTVGGQLISPAGATTLAMAGGVIACAGLDVNGLTITNGQISSTGGTLARFDNVTFAGYLPSATPLTITHPGAATPFTFNNTQFLVTPTSGRYVSVTDANPTDGLVLTITLQNSVPADGSSLTATAGGALVNWATTGMLIAWTNAAGGTWSNPANWSLGRVPTASDSVVIALSGTYTVTLDTTFTANLITLGGAAGTQTLAMSGRTLTLNTGLTVLANGALTLSSSTVTGVGGAVNVGSLNLTFSTIATSLINQGTLVASGSVAITGTLTTAAGSTLRVQGDGSTGFGTLTVASGFTNNGAIELTSVLSGYPSQLAVTAGTLTNATGGTITSVVGAGGPRTLAAALDNQGTLTVNQPLTLGRASAVHTNSGTINVSGAGLTVSQTGTSPSFTNSGTLTVAPTQTLAVSGGAFTQQLGATLNGGGTVALSAATAVFNTTFTLGALSLTSTTAAFTTDLSTAALALTATNSTLTGAVTFTNPAGQTVALTGSTLSTTAVVNQGTLVASGSVAITGTLTAAAGSTLRVQGDGSTGFGTLTVASGFTNNGTIELTSVLSGYPSQLAVTTGTLTNATGGTITSLVGAGGPRTIAAALDNQGTLTVNQPLTLGRASAAHTNSGTINVSGAGLTVSQSGTSPSFTNSGTLTVAPTQTLAVSGGTFTQQLGATLNGGGTVALSAATAVFNTTFTLSALSLVSTTATFTTDLPTAGLALTALNSTLTGSVIFTNTAGQTVTLNGSTLSMNAVVNQGTLVATGSVAITGTLTAAAGSTLRVQGDGSTGFGTLTVASGFTNNGAIELTSVLSGYPSQLAVTTGTLTNATGGTITSVVGAGGPRTLAAALDNQGTLTVNQPLTLSRASAVHTNSGTINVSGAGLTVSQSGTSPSFTNSGTLTVAPTQTLAVSGGTFTEALGGTLNGGGTVALTASTAVFNTTFTLGALSLASTTATFTTDLSTAGLALTALNSTLTGSVIFTNTAGQTVTLNGSTLSMNAVVNQGTLVATGSVAITGTLTTAAGSTLRVQGDGSTGFGTLTMASGFTNNGAIELTSVLSGYPSQLAVTTGTLTNAAGATIAALVGAGGPRTLTAALDNQGSITLNDGLSLALNGSLTSSGTINIALGGLTQGSQYGKLAISGAATLGGTLNVTTFNAFTPASTNAFTVLTYGSVGGDFATYTLPGGAAAWTRPTPPTGTSLVLTKN